MTRRGMTLIELVVVIALMAIIAGVSAPALALLDRRRSVSGVDDVATMLRRARVTAIQRGAVVTVTIDPMTARYWVDPPDTAAFLTMPPQVSLSSPSPRVHFRFAPDGQSITDEPLFVRQAASTRAIVLEPWTGEVRRAAR